MDGVESHQDLPFIVMQYVAGGSLQSRLDREGYMATEEVTRIGLQIAKGLAAAHAQGITHRDIKPSNVLVDCGSDRAIVSDFGLAHVTGDASMTHTGMIAGTPQYMSPEQAEGIRVDVRSDLFSLGCVLYTCCTGVAPFRSESILGILKAVTEAEPTPMRQINPHIAPWLEAFVAKLMAKQMDDRFQTADEVANHLSEELACLQSSEQKPIPERLWWPKSVNLANRSRSRIKTAIVLASLLTAAAFAFAVWDSSYNSGRTANALGIYDAGLRNSGTNQLSGSDYPFATRITPTLAESNYAAAKAAYDLSYETHVQEANLSGDMYESIQRHKRALRLEFDPARSAFHLARAFAIEGREKEMLESFDAALNSGFCDGQSLRSTRDLKLFRGSTVLEKVAKRVAKSEKQLEHLKTVYFVEANYAEAALLGRQRLQTYPNDEFTQLLVAGGLTELAFVDRSLIAEARIWNERIRDSVRYANFGSYNLGCIALMEGKIQTSLDYLHYAVSTGFTDIDHLVSDPMLSDLKHDPRFITLAKTVQNRN
ncbi:MAG TPA: hypothetical protein DDW52_21860 [Planctomycetaceae bacterium]|nr:hypothetical protein [Planctomycetaceae bacterium]